MSENKNEIETSLINGALSVEQSIEEEQKFNKVITGTESSFKDSQKDEDN